MWIFFLIATLASVVGVGIVFWGASRGRSHSRREALIFGACLVIAVVANVLGLVTT